MRLLYLGNATLYSIPIDDTALNGMERQLRALWGAINRAIERSNFHHAHRSCVIGVRSRTYARPSKGSRWLTAPMRRDRNPLRSPDYYGYTPRTSLALVTRRMPFMSAAVRMSTFSVLLMSSTSWKALVIISRSRPTISFSDQKYAWMSWTHSK